MKQSVLSPEKGSGMPLERRREKRVAKYPKFHRKGQERYKVLPGMAIDGKEIRRRVEARTIDVKEGGRMFSDDVMISEAAKAGRLSNHRELLDSNSKIIQLREKIERELKARMITEKQKADESSN